MKVRLISGVLFGKKKRVKCPDEIAAIIIEILYFGLLRTRGAGWSGYAEQAAIEADHLHNLPRLLSNYEPKLLVHYWDTERSCYIEAMKRQCGEYWQAPIELWNQLAQACPFLKSDEEVAAKHEDLRKRYGKN